MKIKVIGKAHLEGTSKKTGKPYNLNQLHYVGKAQGVEGDAAMTMTLPSAPMPPSSWAASMTWSSAPTVAS